MESETLKEAQEVEALTSKENMVGTEIQSLKLTLRDKIETHKDVQNFK